MALTQIAILQIEASVARSALPVVASTARYTGPLAVMVDKIIGLYDKLYQVFWGARGQCC
jgi:hypothetical protein